MALQCMPMLYCMLLYSTWYILYTIYYIQYYACAKRAKGRMGAGGLRYMLTAG